MTDQESKKTEQEFEAAFARLEQILKEINTQTTSLDESLKLYEEANQLIQCCTDRLNEAERRVQVLMKEQGGELTTDKEGQPQMEEFSE